MAAPIIRENRPLNFTPEQIENVLSRRGAKVALAFRDEKNRRRIKKGKLYYAGGCKCCGAWLVFCRGVAEKYVSFPDGYTSILRHIALSD
jgi:hypothetical protein